MPRALTHQKKYTMPLPWRAERVPQNPFARAHFLGYNKEMTMDARKKRLLANLLLLVAGVIWGGGFVVTKNALDTMPVNFLLAVRFSIGALGLSYTFFLKKNRAGFNARLLLGGATLGFLQYAAFAVQTYGLSITTAGKNALITASYIVLVPFVVWAIKKKKPSLKVVIAAFACLLGIGLITFDGGAANLGDALTLLSGILYALHIALVDLYLERHEVMLLTCVQFFFAALFSWAATLVFEPQPVVVSISSFAALLYLGVLATLVALTLQNVGIRYGSPEYASLFMSTESPIGAILGAVFLHEAMSGRMVMGLVLVVAALTLSQLDLKTLWKRRGEKETPCMEPQE